MFYDTLPFAGIVLLLALVAARREPHPIRWPWFILGGLPVALASGSNVVLGAFGLLFVALLAWTFTRRWVRVFAPPALVAVAIPYGLTYREAHEIDTTHERLRQQYPLESVANRIPEPRADLHAPPTGAARARLDEFEDAAYRNGSSRSFQLQRLHEERVRTFVNSPGFGQMRMLGPRRITDETLNAELDRPETPVQPGSSVLWGRGEAFEPTESAVRNPLSKLHADGLLDFVNPKGWGYVKDRDRVAGFLSHRFSKVPEVETWRVQRIELIGLLKHPAPVAYLSDKLPAMGELQNAPTRPLDDFEASALGAIRKGEDVFAAHRGEVVRLVGAIRSARQCVQCHGGERGDLLGAFTYALRKELRP